MSKGLEALERLKTAPSFMGGTTEYKECTNSHILLLQDYEIVRRALLELQSIKESNPSEALECLDTIKEENCCEDNSIGTIYYDECNTIKNYILKAQEQEKVLKIIFEKNVDIHYLEISKTVEEYNEHIEKETDFGMKLTYDEFDFLKRWVR